MTKRIDKCNRPNNHRQKESYMAETRYCNANGKYFLANLNSCGMMDQYPQDPEKQCISRRIEQLFRLSYMQAAVEAAALSPNPEEPYEDIIDRSGLRRAQQQRDFIRCAIGNKKLRRLERDAFYRGRHAPLECYRSNLKRATQRAMRLAYWRGRVHALVSIEQAYYDINFPDGSPYNCWDYFHEKLVKPWALQVKAWATGPFMSDNGESYDCPPDLFSIAFRLANGWHAANPEVHVSY